MQLGGPPGGPPGSPSGADTIPDALRVTASRLGHRPAVAVVREERRDEQGYASLARWTAKGAHLLTVELGAEPGDRVLLHASPGWAPLAACLAAWWVGLTVVATGDAVVSVVEPGPDGRIDAERPGTVFTVGDEPDGSPSVEGEEEPWTVAVQAFPDEPPPSGAEPDTPALHIGGDVLSHAELLEASGRWGTDGVLGVSGSPSLEEWLPALVRPLRVGRHSVVVPAGVDRSVAEADAVEVWL